MSATIKQNITGKIFSSDNNRLKLLNFVIPASMVYHKISINTSNNTIVHNYKIISDNDFSTLNNYINDDGGSRSPVSHCCSCKLQTRKGKRLEWSMQE